MDNTFYRKASDEYSTWVTFNFMAFEEENTTRPLSYHDDYNTFLVTHPPPSTLFISPMNVFDPPVPQSVSYIPHIPRRELIQFF